MLSPRKSCQAHSVIWMKFPLSKVSSSTIKSSKDLQNITSTWWRRKTKKWQLNSRTYFSQLLNRQRRRLQKLSRSKVVQSYTSKVCKQIKCSKEPSKRRCTRSQRLRLPSLVELIFSSVSPESPKVLSNNLRRSLISRWRIGTLPSHLKVSGIYPKGSSSLSLCLRCLPDAVLRLREDSSRIFRSRAARLRWM